MQTYSHGKTWVKSHPTDFCGVWSAQNLDLTTLCAADPRSSIEYGAFDSDGSLAAVTGAKGVIIVVSENGGKCRTTRDWVHKMTDL